MADQRKSSGSRSRSGSSSGGNRSRSGSSNRSRSSSNRSRKSQQSGNGGAPSQRSSPRSQVSEQGAQNGADEPDVLLDVPQLKVDEIALEVENLHARIALETRLGDLLQLHVGADVVVDKVALEIKGVDAQAHLKARLENVFQIIDRTLKTVDQNPEVLTELASAGEQAALSSGARED